MSSSRSWATASTGTIGYWNGLGIFAVIGLFLALGFAARGERLATRAAAGAALPILAATMYFTFSRGAWLALLVGFVAAFAIDERRLQLAFGSAVLGVFPALGVLLASRAGGLTQTGASYASAVRDGHRLAPVLVLLAALSAAAAALALVGGTPHSGAAVAAARLGGGAGRVVARRHRRRCGCARARRSDLVQRGWDKVQAAPQATGNNERLFDLSSNGRLGLWHAAWDTFSDHPAVGVGGGTLLAGLGRRAHAATTRPPRRTASTRRRSPSSVSSASPCCSSSWCRRSWVRCGHGARRSCRSRSRPSSAGSCTRGSTGTGS